MTDTNLRVYYTNRNIVGAFTEEWLEIPENAEMILNLEDLLKNYTLGTNFSGHLNVKVPPGAKSLYFWYWFQEGDGEFGITFNRREAIDTLLHNYINLAIESYEDQNDKINDSCCDNEYSYEDGYAKRNNNTRSYVPMYTTESSARVVYRAYLNEECEGTVFAFPLNYVNRFNEKLVQEFEEAADDGTYHSFLRDLETNEELLSEFENV
jgi:hypothetical protein